MVLHPSCLRIIGTYMQRTWHSSGDQMFKSDPTILVSSIGHKPLEKSWQDWDCVVYMRLRTCMTMISDLISKWICLLNKGQNTEWLNNQLKRKDILFLTKEIRKGSLSLIFYHLLKILFNCVNVFNHIMMLHVPII